MIWKICSSCIFSRLLCFTRSHERRRLLRFAFARFTLLFIFLWPWWLSYGLPQLFLLMSLLRPWNRLTLRIIGQVFIRLIICSCHHLSVTTCPICSWFYSCFHLKDAINWIWLPSPRCGPADHSIATHETATRRRLVFVIKQVFVVSRASCCILCVAAHPVELRTEILWVANCRLWQAWPSQLWRWVLLRY